MEISLLKAVQIMRRYYKLRNDELKKRKEVHKALKELNKKITQTRNNFPFLKVPQIRKKQEEDFEEDISPRMEAHEDIESELKRIQERLNSIGN